MPVLGPMGDLMKSSRGWQLFRRAVCGLLGAAAFVTAAQATAQSAYGCRNLASSASLPAVEGAGGQFFRIDPDMMMDHRLSEQSLSQLKTLSTALAASGTQLLYLPMPTKSLVLPQALPPMAAHLGFDPVVAASVYAETLDRLDAAGIAYVDVRQTLRQAHAAGGAPYFGTDWRLSPEGGAALADVLADRIVRFERVGPLPRARYVTNAGQPGEVASLMRLQLQQNCRSPLPRLIAPDHQTNRAVPGAPDTGAAPVVVLSTALTGTPTTHMAGFLKARIGLDVAQITVAERGAFGAITTYLTSDAFRKAPPAVLVWEHPIWHRLGARGDLPMTELITAARGGCDIPLEVAKGTRPNTARADLTSLTPGQSVSLMIDLERLPVQRLRVDFLSADGRARSRTIERPKDHTPSGRFFLSTDGLWPAGVAVIDITADRPFLTLPNVFLCATDVSR